MKLKSCLSICLHFWHANDSAVSTWMEMRLAGNESCIFEDHKVYKPIVPTIHQQECLEDKGVSNHSSVRQLDGGSSPTVDVFL